MADIDTPFTAVKYVKVTKATGLLPDGTCKGLRVGTAGTANLVDGTGTLRTDVPLFEGDNPLVCREVRTGGTADNIWALYD